MSVGGIFPNEEGRDDWWFFRQLDKYFIDITIQETRLPQVFQNWRASLASLRGSQKIGHKCVSQLGENDGKYECLSCHIDLKPLLIAVKGEKGCVIFFPKENLHHLLKWEKPSDGIVVENLLQCNWWNRQCVKHSSWRDPAWANHSGSSLCQEEASLGLKFSLGRKLVWLVHWYICCIQRMTALW